MSGGRSYRVHTDRKTQRESMGDVSGMWDYVVEHSGSTGRMSYMHIHIYSFKAHRHRAEVYGVLCIQSIL